MTREDLRYARFVQVCRRFLAVSAHTATNEDIAKYLHSVQYELKSIQTSNALVNTPIHDELLALEADFKRISAASASAAFVFPSPDELRQRRVQTIELRKKAKASESVRAILSHVEDNASNAWVEKQASLVDDEFMEFSTEDLAKESKPSIKAIREQLGLLSKESGAEKTSLAAAKSIAEKERLENELEQLSSRLKHATKGLNQNLKDDAHLLGQVLADAELNQAKLDEENRKLNAQREARRQMGCMVIVFLILGLFVVFIGMYIFMKIWSTRHHPVF